MISNVLSMKPVTLLIIIPATVALDVIAKLIVKKCN